MRQSWQDRDPGIGILPILNPGIEKSIPGLQFLVARNMDEYLSQMLTSENAAGSASGGRHT